MKNTGNYFVTLKDHKDNFMNHLTTRLINPSKNEVWRLSQHILSQINTKLVTKLSVNVWKNTISVIKLFENINDKILYNFFQFDVTLCYRVLGQLNRGKFPPSSNSNPKSKPNSNWRQFTPGAIVWTPCSRHCYVKLCILRNYQRTRTY